MSSQLPPLWLKGKMCESRSPEGLTSSASAQGWIARWFRRKATPADSQPKGDAEGSDPQALTPSLTPLAEAHWKQAADLVKATGYHRRDGKLAELRQQLDGLARSGR